MHPEKELCVISFAANENTLRRAVDKIYTYGRGPGEIRYGFFDRQLDGQFTEMVIECDAEQKVAIARRIAEEISGNPLLLFKVSR